MAEIRKKRPCAVCRCWFIPQARVKHRAVTCGRKECQKEWHRRQCQKWNRKNKAYFRSNYLQKKLNREKHLDRCMGPGPRKTKNVCFEEATAGKTLQFYLFF